MKTETTTTTTAREFEGFRVVNRNGTLVVIYQVELFDAGMLADGRLTFRDGQATWFYGTERGVPACELAIYRWHEDGTMWAFPADADPAIRAALDADVERYVDRKAAEAMFAA